MAEKKEPVVEQIENYGLSQKDRPKTMFSKIGIVGCGTTGQILTREIAAKGIEVVFLELSDDIVKHSIQEISAELDNMIGRWGMTSGEKRAILSRIKGTTTYKDFADCDLVMEAILSKRRETSIEVRKEVFKKIEENVTREAIIATHTSTLVITELASELKYKDRCINLHLPTQIQDSNTLEIARSLYTSDEVFKNVKKFAALLGKNSIQVEESPGLISTRLFVSLINEACSMLMEGVGSKEDVDLMVRDGIGMPLGPFEMADKIGLDRVIRWMENLYNEFGDHHYMPSPLLKRLVRAHHYGRKTGEGFYKYDENGKKMK